MATRLTRDHHNLRRNLKLNGNYLSNDGGDEGISIQDDGHVTTGSASVVSAITNTTSANNTALHIDLDSDGGLDSGGQTLNNTGLNLDVTRAVTTTHGSATINNVGIDLDVTSGDTDGDSVCAGIDITTSGADNNFGLKINNEDNIAADGTEADFINYSSADKSDFFYINTKANGETALGTVDGGGTGGHIKLQPNGKLQIHAGSGANPYAYFQVANPYSRLRVNGYNQDDDYLNIDVEADGATTISTIDDAGADADLTIDVDGDITLDAFGGNITFTEDGSTTKFIKFDSDLGNMQIHSATLDYFQINVDTSAATTIRTVDYGGIAGHLTMDIDGHVEFDGCAVGFDQEEETFSDDSLKSTGGTHDTHIDFRIGNKIYLQLTASMDQINLIFPAVSGNFLLLARYDGDWSIGDWKVWESDLTAAITNDVAWPGGTQPDHTDSGRDIYSFYWDADNQTCYGVASLAFATP